MIKRQIFARRVFFFAAIYGIIVIAPQYFMEEKLARDGAVMSDDARRKLERDILGQKRENKRARDEFTEDFNIRRNEELAKMQREIALSIVSLAKEKGYDLILENGVIYASDRVDITEEVIARLKQDYKKKQK